MAEDTKADDKAVITQADLDKAAAKAASDAVAADRRRRADIMGLPEAKGREGLAQHYADNTDDDLDKVKAALSAAPKAAEPEEEADKDTDTDPEAYDRKRTTAAGAGLGGKPDNGKDKPKIDAKGIYAARRAKQEG